MNIEKREEKKYKINADRRTYCSWRPCAADDEGNNNGLCYCVSIRCQMQMVSVDCNFFGIRMCHPLSVVRGLCQPVSGVMCGLCLGRGFPANMRLNTNCEQMSADL